MKAAFQTADTDLATYLYARAYPLLEVKESDRQTIFKFPEEAALSAESFYHGATLSAKNLLYAARKLQSIRR